MNYNPLRRIPLRAWLYLFAAAALAQEPAAAPAAQVEAAAVLPAEAVVAPPAEAVVAPPQWSDRGRVFFKKLFGPQAVLETVPATIFDTARNFPRQWGRGGYGIAKRVGSQYGQFAIGEAIELGVSALHREDPRYFRMAGQPFGRRLGHALKSTVIVRGANGSDTIGLARLADVYGAWAIATLWNPPDQRNIQQIMKYGTLGLGIKAGSNVFREFWPDVKKKLKRP